MLFALSELIKTDYTKGDGAVKNLRTERLETAHLETTVQLTGHGGMTN